MAQYDTIPSGLANPARPTLSSSHSMFIGMGVGVVFVVGATILSGISNGWANFMIALLITMFVIQALSNVEMFATFAEKVKIVPPE